jgi:hypothetical protein
MHNDSQRLSMKMPTVRRHVLSTALLVFLLLPVQNILAVPHSPCCGEITSAGQQLAAVLDGMNVEALWIADQHVNWETGEPDRGAAYEGPGKHTHCSAFAASAAKQLGVYLLRPPEHGQLLLANAQAQWLPSEKGQSQGWRPVARAEAAQAQANRGNLVVVVFANPDQHEPGHVAIVRPSEKSAEALERNGPDIIQAGTHNHTRTVVRIGFSSHPGAWPDGVRYYMHLLNPAR